MKYENIGKQLADCWGNSWEELTEGQQRAWGEAFGRIFDGFTTGRAWNLYSEEERKQRIDAHDQRNDPELCVEFFDKKLNARVWVAMPDVTAEDAAKLLCEINPIDDAPSVQVGKLKVECLRLLQTAFASVARAKPTPRKLNDWREVARSMSLKCYPWFDTYVLAHEQVGAGGTAAKLRHGGAGLDSEPETKNWILLVQAEATKRWKSLRSAGANPTKNSIKDDLATWCRATEVKTDGDINPSGEYIYRHVLSKWTPPNG